MGIFDIRERGGGAGDFKWTANVAFLPRFAHCICFGCVVPLTLKS